MFWIMGREIVSFTDAVRILNYCVISLGWESVCSFGSWGDVHRHHPNPHAGASRSECLWNSAFHLGFDCGFEGGR
jgi:hypothetical protein